MKTSFYCKGLVLCFFLFFGGLNVFGQLAINTTLTPIQLVQNVLVGGGVTVSNVTMTGLPTMYGSFSNGATTNLGLGSGVLLTTGNVTEVAQAASGFMSALLGAPGDPDLDAIGSSGTYDACVLEFDFVPLDDTIKFRYVFGSEEYPEFVNSSYNDVFAFFITGPNPLGGNYTNQNIALIPGTMTFVAINNVNDGYSAACTSPGAGCTNCAYYVNNCNGGTIVFDGFTTVLTAKTPVTPCQTYHMKLAVADVGDGAYDSGVFLEANSFSAGGINVTPSYSSSTFGNNAVEGCTDGIFSFTTSTIQTSPLVINYTIGGTATNGTDYTTIGNSITIPTGSDSAAVIIHPLTDGLTEGTETVILTITSVCTTQVFTININDNTPVIPVASGDATLCLGGSTMLSVTASGGIGPYSYNWSNGGGTGSSFSVSPVTTTTYIVTVTDICGQNATDDVTVTINSNIALAISPTNPTICPGDPVSLTATGATNYTWAPPTGLSATTGATVIASPTSTTTYTVTGTSSGCSGTGTVTVTTANNLTVSVIPTNPTICPGDPVTLTASGSATNYTWSPATGLSTTTGASVIASPLTTTTYTVTGASGGCTGSAIVIVNVNPLPVADAGLSQTVCSGASAALTASGGGTYQWSTGQTTASIIVSPGSTTTYTVTVSLNGCNSTDDVTITSLNPPPVDAGPDVAICIGNQTQLNATGGLIYSWSPALGLSNTTINNPIASPSVTTTYYLSSEMPVGNMIFNGDFEQGSAGISSDYVEQLDLGPEGYYYVGTNPSICNSGFSACPDHTSGSGNMMIVNGAGTPGVNVWCQTISVTTNTDYDFSTWAASMNNGSPAILQFSINGLMMGSAFSLTTTPCVWSQFFSAWNSGSNTTANICIVNQNTTLVGNDFALDDISFSPLCTTTDSVTVTVNPLPNAQISSFTPATCGLNNGSATATGGTTYLWSNGPTTSTITGLAPGNYSVTVTSAAGCSSTTSITINNIPGPTVIASSTNENCGHANGTASSTPSSGVIPYTYLWSNSHTTQNITNLPAGTYTVTVTDANSCTASASVIITNIAGPSLQVLSFSNETCSYGNGSATVNAINGAPPYQYLWSNGNSSATVSNLHAGTFTITVTDANGCTANNSVTITNSPGPNATITGIDFASCGTSDGSAILTVNGGALPYTFLWSPGGQVSQNLTGVPMGNYSVVVTDNNGCTTSSQVLIGEDPGPSATTSSENEICDQANGTATVNATGGLGVYTYLWSDSNGQTTSTAIGLAAGTYAVTVSDGGCSTIQTVNVMETPGPNAGFSANPQVLTIMEGPVSFLNNSSGNIVNWAWTLGDGSLGNGESFDHQYTNIGTYLVTLIVTDNNGCQDTTIDTIKVKDIYTIYIPNVFTPNGDAVNDYFFPQGVSVDPDNFDMYIFDRWGNMVFHTSKWLTDINRSEGWNGTQDNNGSYNDVVMDVYVYRILAKEVMGPKHEYIGRIALIP